MSNRAKVKERAFWSLVHLTRWETLDTQVNSWYSNIVTSTSKFSKNTEFNFFEKPSFTRKTKSCTNKIFVVFWFLMILSRVIMSIRKTQRNTTTTIIILLWKKYQMVFHIFKYSQWVANGNKMYHHTSMRLVLFT